MIVNIKQMERLYIIFIVSFVLVAGMMSQHATKIQQHPSAFNSMQSNTQQPSASLRSMFSTLIDRAMVFVCE